MAILDGEAVSSIALIGTRLRQLKCLAKVSRPLDPDPLDGNASMAPRAALPPAIGSIPTVSDVNPQWVILWFLSGGQPSIDAVPGHSALTTESVFKTRKGSPPPLAKRSR